MAEDPMTIQQIRSLLESQIAGGPQEIRPVGPAQIPEVKAPDGASFSEFLKGSIEEVNNLMLQADKATVDLATAKSTDIQGTILAVEKAEISFKLMMEVRNKILSAYNEVMRTQV